MKLRIYVPAEPRIMSRIAQGVVRILAIGSLVISSTVLGPLAIAQPNFERTKPVDVVLLFDTSGSMLKTDPMQLRFKGAKDLARFLGKGDRLGIIGFSDKAEIVRPLKYVSPEAAPELEQDLARLSTSGQHTDIFEGVMAADKMLESNYRAGVEKAIVLISDGKMEPAPDKGIAFARTLALVHDNLPVLKAKETRVYTIALSEYADRPLLKEIAGATNGVAFYAANASELDRAFDLLFEAMVPSQAPGAITRKFYVEESAEEATFYVSHSAGARILLISPRGDHMSSTQMHDHVQWFSGENVDVITVREPESGDWEVQGIEPADAFVTVLTDLKFAIDAPVAIRVDEPGLIQARLFEGERPVALPHMSRILRFGFHVIPTDRVSAPVHDGELNDEGRDGDKVAQDGIFSRKLTLAETGDYRLNMKAKSPTFEREKQVPFKVKPKLITLEAVVEAQEHAEEAAEEGHAAEASHEHDEAAAPASEELQGDERVVFRAVVSKEVTTFKDVSVTLIARSSDRKRIEIPFRRSVEDRLVYEVPAGALPKDGRYAVHAEIKGVEHGRVPVRSETPELFFTRTMAPREEAETPVKVIVRHPEPVEKAAEFPLIPVLLVTAVNVVLGLAAYIFLWKKPSVRSAPTPKYIPQKALLDAIGDLEKRVSQTDIGIDDPIFSDASAAAGKQEPLQAQPAEAQPPPEPEREPQPEAPPAAPEAPQQQAP